MSRSVLQRVFAVVFFVLAIAWLALSPTVRAVTPAPDGGYQGANTAEGTNALFSLTTGTSNTALGFQALFRNTSGIQNTASGLDALFHNTTGARNTANGCEALLSNTTGVIGVARVKDGRDQEDGSCVMWRHDRNAVANAAKPAFPLLYTVNTMPSGLPLPLDEAICVA